MIVRFALSSRPGAFRIGARSVRMTSRTGYRSRSGRRSSQGKFPGHNSQSEKKIGRYSAPIPPIQYGRTLASEPAHRESLLALFADKRSESSTAVRLPRRFARLLRSQTMRTGDPID